MSDIPPHLYKEDIVEPTPASTVIPVRDGEHGIEIYMTQRAKKLRFLGGFYVFPGGMLDEDDYTEETLRLCDGLSPEQAKAAFVSELPPERCLGHWVAGIRELFEESGILLALDKDGKPPRTNDEESAAMFKRLRKDVHDNRVTMTGVMTQLGLKYDVGAMKYFSHWITPPGPPKRFDTRFFVAPMPDGQTASVLGDEVEQAIWISAEDAIAKAKCKEWRMIPPTIISLQTVSRHKSVSDLIKSI